ncbi:MAG: BON domain-containing protein [Parachlamydiaceae bacterium]
MKNYMLVAAAISVIGTGTLFADYYQQGSGYYYPSHNESNFRTQEFDHPPHHFNPNNYGTQPSSYQSRPQNSSSQPSFSQGSAVQQSYPSQQQPQGSTPGPMQYHQQGSQSYLQKKTRNNQEVVRSNNNDKFTTDDDRRLGFQIRQQIAEKFPQADLNVITIYIDDGSVRLLGKVRSEQLRVDLSNLIKELKGVKSVTNKLEVHGQSGRSSRAASETNTKYTHSQQKNAYRHSTSKRENIQALSNNVSSQDSLLEEKIRQSIASDHSLSPQAKSIGVLVSSRSITLNGTVKSEIEKSRIAAKVRGMGEGRTINNMLEINKTR